MRPRLVPQLYLLALFFVAALLAYSSNLTSYFLSDDFVQIGKVLHGDFSVVWGQSHGGFFRPVFILSYILDSRIWHERPLGYHLTNVAIHALNSFFVFQLSLRLLEKLNLAARSMKAAAVAAATLFLLHPSHTEAVTWISGRADLIATLFCLATLWCYRDYVRRPRWSRLTLALGLCTAALLAKESAICLPFLILIIGLYFSRVRKALVDFGMFAVVVVAFILVRASLLGAIVGGYGTNQHLNFAPGWIRDRILEAIVRSAFPAVPASWSFFLFKPLKSPLFYLIVLAVCLLFAIAIAFRRRRYDRPERKRQNRFMLVLAGLFFVSLLPAINLKLNLSSSLGERFLYLPTVFSCLLISYVLLILIRNPKVWLLVVICALGFYSWRLYVANHLWREAAQLTSSIRQDFAATSSPDRLTILNAPDNLRGVPIFHNGLPEALQLFQNPGRFQQVEINAFQNLQSTSDAVDLRNSADTLTLQSTIHLDTFDRASSSECLELLSQSIRELQFQLRPCPHKTDTYFFSGGKMRRVFEQER